MDDIVKAAIAKWPNVPHCYGWLALDARGHWRMRDDRCQALNLPGDIIRHPTLIAFINRNYLPDEHGCWYFQNGPQRVYVDIEAAPWIATLTPAGLQLHTGTPSENVMSAYFDEEGRLFFCTESKLILLDDRDLAACLELISGQHNEPVGMDKFSDWLESAETQGLQLTLPGATRPVPLQKTTLHRLKEAHPFQATPRPNLA